jgi:hypothetical protein
MIYTVFWSGERERSGACPSLIPPRLGGSSLSFDRIVTHDDSTSIDWTEQARRDAKKLRAQIRKRWQRQRRRRP